MGVVGEGVLGAVAMVLGSQRAMCGLPALDLLEHVCADYRPTCMFLHEKRVQALGPALEVSGDAQFQMVDHAD